MYEDEKDAMPVKLHKHDKNNLGTWKGTCYTLQNYYKGKPGDYVSFTNDGSWLGVTYGKDAAVTLEFVE